MYSGLRQGFDSHASVRRLASLAIAAAAIVATPRIAHAACTSWVGGMGLGNQKSDWSYAPNWSAGAVPTSTTDVCLDAMATRAPDVDVDAVAKSITASSAFTYNLTFTAGALLHVYGDVSWAAAGRIDYGTNSGNITIDGSVTLSAGSWTKQSTIAVSVGHDLIVSGGTFTGSSGSLYIGRDLNVSAGTYAGSSSTHYIGRNLNVTSTGTFTITSGLLDITGNLNLSGTAFTASSTMTRVGAAFTHSAGTYNDNNGNILFDAATNQTHTFGGAVFKRATFNDSMPGYWNMDDSSFGGTTPVDNSGYLNAGASTNVSRNTTACAPLAFYNPSCATFDGTAYVQPTIKEFPATNAAQSIAVWMNIANTATDTIVGLTGTSAAIRLGITTTLLRVTRDDGTALVSTTVPSTAAWHHVAYTWDGTNNRLYVDGVLANSSTTAHDSAAITSVFFGATSASAGFYEGDLDDLRIYRRALTAQEVNSLALGRLPGTGIATHTLADAYTGSVGSNVADFVIASGTVTGSAGISIEGSWLNYGGRFTGTGTVTMTSAGGESILSGGSAFSALTISGNNGSSTNTLRDRLWIPNGALTITSGRLSTGGYNVHVGSMALTSGATFTVSTGTVIYDSTTDTTLPSAVLTTYNRLRIEDPSETSLVGYWKLDEGSGSAGARTRDWSGTGNTGTLSSTGANWIAAPTDMEFDNASAMSFDGSTGYVSTAVTSLPSSGASQSISAWINVSGLPASSAGIVSLNGTSSTIRLGLSTTALQVTRNDGTALVSTTAPATGGWHHVAYTWDGTTNRLYLDGSSVATSTTSHDNALVTSAIIGASTTSTGFYNGKVDDVRVYNAVLSAAQVTRLDAGRYAGTGGSATFTLGANTAVNSTFAIDAGNFASSGFTFNAALTSSAAIVSAGSYSVGSTTNSFPGGLTIRGGTTLNLQTASGSLRIATTKTLTMDGTLNANQSTATIRNNGSGNYAFKVGSAAGATPTLNITGLIVQNTDTNGMWINADTGAVTTFTRFDNIAFSSGTGALLLQIYATGLFLTANGCTFDNGITKTTTNTVKLTGNGHTGSPDTTQTRATFGGALCSSGYTSCQASKVDDDSNNDGVATTPASNGAVIQFVRAAQADTAGSVVGLPSPALDWNTGAYYSTYVAYNGASGGTNPSIYVRNASGAGLYSWTSPVSDLIVGTPRYTTAGTTHYVYVAMSSGRVYQLVDTGSALTTVGSAWTTNPYVCTGCTIVTPLALDSNNLYWGGTQGGNNYLWTLSMTTELQPFGSPFPLTPSVTTASLATRIVGGTTQVFAGSIGHILQINVTNQSLAADNSNPGTASVFGRISLGTNGAHRIYAGDDGGRMWSLDPTNFSGTNKAWSYTVASDAIKSSPYYHYSTNSIQFGTEAGKLVVLNSSGTAYTGYPYVPGSTSDQMRGLLYWSGILVAGTQNGKLFFLDRNNGTTGPTLLVQYFFGPSEVVSGIGYDITTNRYMVSVADPSLNNGRVYFFDSITDPTSGAL